MQGGLIRGRSLLDKIQVIVEMPENFFERFGHEKSELGKHSITEGFTLLHLMNPESVSGRCEEVGKLVVSFLDKLESLIWFCLTCGLCARKEAGVYGSDLAPAAECLRGSVKSLVRGPGHLNLT